MDPSSVDKLARLVASSKTRRGLFGTGVAAIAVSLGAGKASAKAPSSPRLRRYGEICRKDMECESTVCETPDRFGRRYCGCFVAGTRIAMADGTSRPIELVDLGDEVLGADGAINRVQSLLRPFLGNRPLYSFNDSAPFVTADHPFMVNGAWKAVEPNGHAALDVERLLVGDHLQILTGVAVAAGRSFGGERPQAETRVEPFALSRIHPSHAAPGTQLYNLHLDGNHTYFANDLLVHNKR